MWECHFTMCLLRLLQPSTGSCHWDGLGVLSVVLSEAQAMSDLNLHQKPNQEAPEPAPLVAAVDHSRALHHHLHEWHVHRAVVAGTRTVGSNPALSAQLLTAVHTCGHGHSSQPICLRGTPLMDTPTATGSPTTGGHTCT